jgi:hypothetical protein
MQLVNLYTYIWQSLGSQYNVRKEQACTSISTYVQDALSAHEVQEINVSINNESGDLYLKTCNVKQNC